MPDYTLYYWPIAFRGQFIRAVLTAAGSTWDEADFDTIAALKSKPPADQPVPHMGPPVLIDHATGFSLSQMPAILAYLGEKHGLTPDEPQGVALTNKVVADANDVLYEMTLYNGAQMWTPDSWSAFRPRLKRWMSMFEEIGRRHKMTAEAGTLLGTSHPGIADLTTYVLWHTMTEKLPTLLPLLEETAPATAGLCRRIADIPQQAALREKSDALYGDTWCAGQIEASLRTVLDN
ncbi:glutathione S-transferase [Hoeflea prorocentri]|uniref:Glutathione S-transferase n=1 Tax=Hoeflea prorocentri TaxID=1922333 RepID=A0A9X3ZID2_9HYPH|nr:glutathione S-transferase [Hoeflea prorocentri]MCY6382319.1 glutathione S-transferase [Hoeflea prorocentri]MDA5400119.1 glutathione S-transferase [Hoeflea prorocentri]